LKPRRSNLHVATAPVPVPSEPANLTELAEEVKQLRAAIAIYRGLVERLLAERAA
jgi:hypothetical protein